MKHLATLGFLAGLLTTALVSQANSFVVDNTGDSGTGSLRQAIINANSAGNGPHTISFAIPSNALTGSFGSKRAVIALATPLPAITVSGVTIDGLTQTNSTAGNTNTGTLGTTTTVGVDGTTITAVERPEVEITLPVGSDYILAVQAASCTVRGIAIHGAGYTSGLGGNGGGDRSMGAAIRMSTGASNFVITQCIVGSPATTFAYPSDNTYCGVYGISVGSTTDGSSPVGTAAAGTGTASGTISSSLIGFTGNSGVFVINNSTTAAVTITGCQFNQNGYNVNGGDAITLGGSVGAKVGPATVSNNLITAPNSSGVQLEVGSTSATTISNNTMISCGLGAGSASATSSLEGSAICYLTRNAANAGSAGDRIEKNIIRDSEASGIVVGYNQKAVRILQNQITRNGSLSIDLIDNATALPGNGDTYGNGDKVTPNRNNSTTAGTYAAVTTQSPNGGIDYPIFSSAVLNGNQLTVSGYVGTAAGQSTFGGATVEIYEADDDGNNGGPVIATNGNGDGKTEAHGELGRYLGQLTAGSDGRFSGTLTVSDVTADNKLAGTAWLSGKGTSEVGTVYPVTGTTVVKATDVVNAVLQNTAARTNLSVSLQGSSTVAISSFKITSLPAAASGTLYYNNGTSVVPVRVGLSIPLANAGNLSFDPADGFSGNAVAGYTATDANGRTSDGNATVTIPVNDPPVANDVTNATLANTLAATSISPLRGTDSDGTVTSFTVTTLPAAAAGILYYNDNGTNRAVTANQTFTYANANTLLFDPAAGYNGQAVFNYTATDNNGGVSAAAVYTIPVGTGTSTATNSPPTAATLRNDNIPADAGTTTLKSLSGTDSDGTVAGFTITSLPGTGTLYFNGDVAQVNTIVLASQANLLSYKPNGRGEFSFKYTATDNGNATSSEATFTIPVVAPLPVQLVTFTAQASGRTDARLTWTTASELDNDHFEIERSLDGEQFVQIGQVAGQGSKVGATNYAYLDAGAGEQLPAGQPVYYRLRQVDTDGAASYSAVRVVSFARTGVALYPNPAPAAATLDLSVLPPTATYTVALLDLAGRLVSRQVLAGGLVHSLDLAALASGTYLVQVQGPGLSLTQRLTRE